MILSEQPFNPEKTPARIALDAEIATRIQRSKLLTRSVLGLAFLAGITSAVTETGSLASRSTQHVLSTNTVQNTILFGALGALAETQIARRKCLKAAKTYDVLRDDESIDYSLLAKGVEHGLMSPTQIADDQAHALDATDTKKGHLLYVVPLSSTLAEISGLFGGKEFSYTLLMVENKHITSNELPGILGTAGLLGIMALTAGIGATVGMAHMDTYQNSIVIGLRNTLDEMDRRHDALETGREWIYRDGTL
jgi:hypothetical protein